ncbi:MAG: hypothetical protein AAF327_10185 [Cyanobacteria bacterium P01_A01_bin.37]
MVAYLDLTFVKVRLFMIFNVLSQTGVLSLTLNPFMNLGDLPSLPHTRCTPNMKELYNLVQAATPEQRANLEKLTGSTFGSSPDTLCNHIKFLRAGSIGQLFYDKSWKQIVTDLADHIHCDWEKTLNGRRWEKLPTQDIENAVVEKLFQDMFSQLSPDQQEKIILKTQSTNKQHDLEALIATGGAMVAARASGFGVYLMASTVLGGISNALGITLPFAIYMGMSQTIALFIGPVGWAALGGGILYKLNQPNWKSLTAAVVYVSVIRHRKNSD